MSIQEWADVEMSDWPMITSEYFQAQTLDNLLSLSRDPRGDHGEFVYCDGILCWFGNDNNKYWWLPVQALFFPFWLVLIFVSLLFTSDIDKTMFWLSHTFLNLNNLFSWGVSLGFQFWFIFALLWMMGAVFFQVMIWSGFMQIAISLAYLEQWDIVSNFVIGTYNAIRDFIIFLILNFRQVVAWFGSWIIMSLDIIGQKLLELLEWYIHKDDYKNQ